VIIPAGTEISALGPLPIGPVKNFDERDNVDWDGCSLSMFLVDLQTRAELVPPKLKRLGR
jgi:hypothetical protein